MSLCPQLLRIPPYSRRVAFYAPLRAAFRAALDNVRTAVQRVRPPAAHALPYVEAGRYNVPRQHLYTGGSLPPQKEPYLNWNRILQKSAKLISLTES